MRFLVTYCFSLLFLSVTCSPSCPSENDILPCECTEQDDYLEVDCFSKDVTLDKLASVLKVLDKSVAIDLVLDEMDLGSLPSNFFAGSNIRKLELVHCELTSLSDAGGKPLTGLENTLEELVIMSSISEDTQNAKLELSHLKRLTELDLSYNTIKELGNNWFPDSLTVLMISNNGIQNLDDHAFENLHNLESLSLDGNRFGPISRSMFPNPASALEELELDNNAITSVPANLFTNMPELRSLSLRTNGIRRIEEHIFKSIWTQIGVIDFQGNPLECDSHIDWMNQLKTEAIIRGTCQAPHDKRGVRLEDLIKQN